MTTRRGKPFEPGQSGNPEGRKPGPNAITKATRARIAEEGDPIGFLASVMKGEPQPYGEGEAETHQPTMADRMTAARALANKLAPDAKDRPLSFAIGAIDGPPDALKAMARVVESMSDGELTASEAAGVMSVVGSYLDAWKANDLEARMRALEAAQETRK